MATKLDKKITREVTLNLGTRQNQEVNVSLLPNGTIEFHPKGTRQRYRLGLSTVYVKAVTLHGGKL